MPQFARELADERPDEVALRDPYRAMGWAEVADVLNRVANGLRAMDLGPKMRIAVFAENAAETALAHLGGLLGGASTVPVNFHLTADETAYILEDSKTRLLSVGPETLLRGVEAAAAAGVPTVIGWRCPPTDGVVEWNAWLAGNADDDPLTDIKPLPNLLYTSGTTGRPKGTDLPPTMFAGGTTIAEHLEELRKNRFAVYSMHLVVGPMYRTGPLSGMRLLVAGKPAGGTGAGTVPPRHRGGGIPRGRRIEGKTWGTPPPAAAPSEIREVSALMEQRA
jgi:long-subunit acyl-CoA synthetase (AMP-forming)